MESSVLTVQEYSSNWRSNSSYHYVLNDGTKIPKVGLGTSGMKTADEVYQGVVDAGYRHIDTLR